MRTKNRTTVITIATFVLVLCGCHDDFLDKNPTDQISNQTFWTSEDDIDMAVTGCYACLKETFLDHKRGFLVGLSDEGYVHWGWYNIDNMARGNINASTGGLINIVYYGSYVGIAQCNNFMANVDKVTHVSEHKRNEAKGEVRFLRALYYFELVNCFGDVILYKETPESVEAAKIAKSPKEDVLEFIHEDLDFAIAHLPDEVYSGHAVKGTAMGIKTRVLLTQERWAEAADLAQQIIQSGKFGLYHDYPNMFLNAGQTNNPEIMFSCMYLSPDSYHSEYGMNQEYAVSFFLTKELKDAFECTDGLSITESPLYDPANTFANRDPRHRYIVRNPVGTDWEGHYKYDFIDPTGVKNLKYIDPSIPGDYANAYRNDWDFILLRYADVLLMYAEAKNEADGPDQSVYDAINEVRSRPGVNMPPVDQGRYHTKEKLREYIRHERFVELAVEGIHYFDLKRWHIIGDVMNGRINPSGEPYVFEEKNYHWAFPQLELDANPNLKQTTGY
jgi:hypothetical protein